MLKVKQSEGFLKRINDNLQPEGCLRIDRASKLFSGHIDMERFERIASFNQPTSNRSGDLKDPQGVARINTSLQYE